MEAWLLAKQAEIEAIKADLQGMVVENQYISDQLAYGKTKTRAYSHLAFRKKADELRGLAVCIMQHR